MNNLDAQVTKELKLVAKEECHMHINSLYLLKI